MATTPATAAPSASMESKPLTGLAADAAVAARLVAAAGAAPEEVGCSPAPVDGRWAMLGAPALGALVENTGAGFPPAVAAAGPPGGNAGNLIVGAAVGFGGKLIRTVSFLGCTLPVSFFGGTAPWGALGIFGIFSAIILCGKLKLLHAAVKP